jgi:hypothetical protein
MLSAYTSITSPMYSVKILLLRFLLDWAIIYVLNFSTLNLLDLVNFLDSDTFRVIVSFVYFSCTRGLPFPFINYYYY